jgi:hypothetical protein
VVGLAPAQHGVEDVDASARERDHGLVVGFALGSLGCVEGFAGGVVERAEGGLEEDPLECLGAGGGAFQDADLAGSLEDGCALGRRGELVGRCLELAVELGDPLPGLPGVVGQLAHQPRSDALAGQGDLVRARRGDRRLGQAGGSATRDLPRLGDVLGDPVLTGAADLGRRDIAPQELLGTLLERIDDALQPRMDRGQQVAQPPVSLTTIGRAA